MATSLLRRLQVAGYAAPIVREAGRRKVTVISRDGNPIRTTDTVAVRDGLLAAAGMEFSVVEEDPARCEACGCRKSKSAQGKWRTGRVTGRRRCLSCFREIRCVCEKMAEATGISLRTVERVLRRQQACSEASWRKLNAMLALWGLELPMATIGNRDAPRSCDSCGGETIPTSRNGRRCFRCNPRRRGSSGPCSACGAQAAGGNGFWRKGLCARCYQRARARDIKRTARPCRDCGTVALLSNRGYCAPCGQRRLDSANEAQKARASGQL